MLQSPRCIVIILSFLILSPKLVFSDKITQKIELPVLSISTKELVSEINDIFYHLKEINNNERIRGSLALDDSVHNVKLDLPIEEKAINKFPKKAYKASIYIYSSKIDSLDIYLSDLSRIITVSGDNANYVKSVLYIANEKLSEHKARFRGIYFRFLLFILFQISVGFVRYSLFPELNKPGHLIGSFFIVIIGVLICIIPNWEYHFPGFFVSKENLPFYEKHQGLIGLISLLLSPTYSIGVFLISKIKIFCNPKPVTL